MRISLTKVGPVADDLLEALVPILKNAFKGDVAVEAPLPLPASAYNGSRNQHLSSKLLDVMAARKRPEVDRFLGIADVDLYVPELNFVFGEADAQRAVAVFSLARLHTPDRDTFVHRAATEAIHELGHTYDLTHCRDPCCVMWFSNTLAETDRKGTEFCATHRRALEENLGLVSAPDHD